MALEQAEPAVPHRFVARLQESTALRYALAPACVALAVLLHLSAVGPFLHPTGLFFLAVVAAAWFGGMWPGFLAALLATLVLPHLIAMNYPLLGEFFDLPRFLAFGITGLAVGWGTMRRRRAEGELRRSERELRQAGMELETRVAQRTEALRRSEERYERAMLASEGGFWDWDAATDGFYVSPKLLEMGGFPPGTTFAGRADFMARAPFHPADRAKWERAVRELFAGGDTRLSMEVRVMVAGATRWINLNGICTRDAEGRVLRWSGTSNDVTARKSAEEALRASEEQYARAMEGSDSGHWDWNLVTDEMFVSERARQMLALPAGELPTRRNELMALVPQHPEDAALMARQVQASIESGCHERDYRVIPLPGVVRWLRSRGKVFRDEAGRAVRMTGSLTDITDRTLAVEALRASEERYGLAMEASEEGHFDWNVQTDEIFVSVHVKKILGVPHDAEFATRGDLIARIPYHFDDAQWLADMTRTVMAGRALRHEFEYRVLLDGEIHWMRAHWKILRDAAGVAQRVIGVVSDITAGKRIEEELRARQEMLDLAQKSARAIAFEWRIGRGEGENRWSPDLEAMYGFAPGTYDGTYETWKKRVHPDDWPAVREAITHAHRTGDVAAEYRVVHPDASVHWLQAKGRMFFDREGRPARMVGFMQDVTQRRHAEEELRKMERQLRQAQRLEAVGTLAGGIAHDFNNILGAILGYGEMALRDARPGSRLRRDLDSIMTAGERGRALVDRILAFSRSGVGERVPVHVEKVVRESLELLEAKLPEGIAIETRLRAGRAAMLGDPTQVHQVLMNLGTNAVQAMGASGTLSVSLEAQRFDAARAATIGTVAAADYLVLTVADSGSGMAPDTVERIFDPFFTTKEVGVGTGLGLSLVHGIVAELGGAIDVATTAGAGSTFTVYLPRAGDAEDLRARDEPEAPRGDGQCVLVVDDEEPLVRLATRTLEELGYAPVGFTSSAAAMAAFRADPRRFDALITDERMPGLSGSALIREVRDIRGRIPIVLMSGCAGGATSRACNPGADEVLRKPLSAHELAASLAKVLRL